MLWPGMSVIGSTALSHNQTATLGRGPNEEQLSNYYAGGIRERKKGRHSLAWSNVWDSILNFQHGIHSRNFYSQRLLL